jgi:hypothetical protein
VLGVRTDIAAVACTTTEGLDSTQALCQLGLISIGLAFLTTNVSLMTSHFIASLASLFFMIWGALAYDASFITYNAIFLLLNIGQGVYVLIQKRPAAFDHPDSENIYHSMFEPVSFRLESLCVRFSLGEDLC